MNKKFIMIFILGLCAGCASFEKKCEDNGGQFFIVNDVKMCISVAR